MQACVFPCSNLSPAKIVFQNMSIPQSGQAIKDLAWVWKAE